MPILAIEAVGELERKSGAAQRASDAAGEVFGVKPGRCWVKLSVLPSGQYAENGGVQEGVSPVFVSVILGEAPKGDARCSQCRNLAKALAAALDRPVENIHIIYEPDAKGRIAFGGRLLE